MQICCPEIWERSLPVLCKMTSTVFVAGFDLVQSIVPCHCRRRRSPAAPRLLWIFRLQRAVELSIRLWPKGNPRNTIHFSYSSHCPRLFVVGLFPVASSLATGLYHYNTDPHKDHLDTSSSFSVQETLYL